MNRKIIITESQYKRIFSEGVLSKLSSVAVDGGLDTISAGINTIPFVEWVVAGTGIIKNFAELKTGTEELNSLVENLSTEEEISDAQLSIIIDIVDLVQRVIEILPALGIDTGLSLSISAYQNAAILFSSEYISSFLNKSEKILEYLKMFEELAETHIMNYKLLPDSLKVHNIALDALDALGKSAKYVDSLEEKTPFKEKLSKKLSRVPQNIKDELGLGGMNY